VATPRAGSNPARHRVRLARAGSAEDSVVGDAAFDVAIVAEPIAGGAECRLPPALAHARAPASAAHHEEEDSTVTIAPQPILSGSCNLPKRADRVSYYILIQGSNVYTAWPMRRSCHACSSGVLRSRVLTRAGGLQTPPPNAALRRAAFSPSASPTGSCGPSSSLLSLRAREA
jgi:hypothetical protein